MASKMSLRILAMGVMASSLVVGGATVAAASHIAPKPVVYAAGALKHLAAATNPTDGAKAKFLATAGPTGTRAVLVVKGLPSTAVGSTFGAHVHTGPCVADEPKTAGPHYNTGGPASPQTEIWLDFTVLPGGVGIAQTTVPFTIAPGAANSVVIHALPTGPGGVAGPRLACLPVSF